MPSSGMTLIFAINGRNEGIADGFIAERSSLESVRPRELSRKYKEGYDPLSRAFFGSHFSGSLPISNQVNLEVNTSIACSSLAATFERSSNAAHTAACPLVSMGQYFN